MNQMNKLLKYKLQDGAKIYIEGSDQRRFAFDKVVPEDIPWLAFLKDRPNIHFK